MNARFDIAIIGGGLSGLSLAVRLADLPPRRVLVIEPRDAYRRDRTWCSWRLADHPFGEAVAARWPSWDVIRSAGDGERLVARQTAPEIPYEMIPADRLYRLAEARLAAAGTELRRGTRVDEVEEREDCVLLRAGGETVAADLVFDSRPPPAEPGDLLQRFLGQEVETDRDVFEPGRATLMDFAVPQQPGVVHFLYVLPSSARAALVEDTWFARGDVELPDYREAIRRYLAERFGVERFAVGFEEEGAIPMTPRLKPGAPGRRVIPIGTAGGAVKPSSGYAFFAIQRMADALAEAVAAGRRPEPFEPRGARARWMDEVFLTAIEAAPEEAGTIFHSLFERCPPAPLIRFLNDVGSLADAALVVAATPKLPLIAAALSRVRPPPPEPLSRRPR
ncbi:MAG: hypothetical protein JO048_04365 [Methylobacteriaceae bacterium]|nr:hypothetical protein [Methylobacteriaceae bacterium]